MFQNLKGSKCSYSSNSKHDVGNPAKADYLINVEVVLEITEWCTEPEFFQIYGRI